MTRGFRAAMIVLSSGFFAGLSGCGYVNFNRPVTDEELVWREQIHSFYTEVQEAFAAGSPDLLVSLFSPSITHPMSYAKIDAWARKFFAENGNARFLIEKLEIDEIGPVQAVVTLSYRVKTRDGKADFGGTERDTLVQSKGRWSVASWDRVSPLSFSE